MVRTRCFAACAASAIAVILSTSANAQWMSGHCQHAQPFSYAMGSCHSGHAAQGRHGLIFKPTHQFEPTRNALRLVSHGWGRGHHYRSPGYSNGYYNPYSPANTPRYVQPGYGAGCVYHAPASPHHVQPGVGGNQLEGQRRPTPARRHGHPPIENVEPAEDLESLPEPGEENTTTVIEKLNEFSIN